MENELPFTTRGDESKPALVLMHGLMRSNLQWTYNLEALEQHFYVILVELWGHGFCGLPEQVGAFSPDNYCHELEVIRHIIGVPQWYLLGSGYSAGIVMQYAKRHFRAVAGVAITNSQECVDADVDQLKHRLLHELRGYQNLSQFSAHPINEQGVATKLRDKMITDANAISKTAILGALSYLDAVEHSRSLRQFAAPLLVMNGQQDRPFQAKLKYLQQQLPAADVVSIDAGAALMIDASEAFNSAIIERWA